MLVGSQVRRVAIIGGTRIPFARSHGARTKKAGRDVSREETLVRQAETNYQAVSAGRGTHNFRLSREMLRVAQANLDKVLAAKRKK